MEAPMRHWPWKSAFLLAVVLITASSKESAAFYDCHTASTRTADGNGATITSPTFTHLVGSGIAIATIGGSCARVEFSAQIRARHPKGIKVRVVVVGHGPLGIPAEAELYTSESRFDTRTVSFVIKNMPPGQKTVKIHVLSVDGTAVSVGRWTMSVHHDGAY
jgi:hypothetical protein